MQSLNPLVRGARALIVSVAVFGLAGCAQEAPQEAPAPTGAVQDPPSTAPETGAECGHDAECSSPAAVALLCSDSRCIEGACVVIPRENMLPCDDGDACTKNSRCEGGLCGGGQAVWCGDDNPCTYATCDPIVGCLHVNQADGELCDDGDPCSLVDVCQSGICTGESTGECSCASDEDCTVHDDDNICNGLLRCLSGQCELDASAVVSCPPPGPCLEASCDPSTGQCTSTVTAEGTPCDDGNICTEDDHCVSGTCESTGSACGCETDDECGSYQQGDYDYCQGPLICLDSVCVPDAAQAVTCEGANPGSCLVEICESSTGLCTTSFATEGTPCTDASLCDAAGSCDLGICLLSSQPCDDGDPCTEDVCDPDGGCLHLPFEGPCEDGDPCTVGELCGPGGLCEAGSPATCDDADPCTEDVCSTTSGGCVHTPVGEDELCETDDMCLGTGTCKSGACVDQPPVVCVTTSPCMVPTCDPGVGCVEVADADGTPCEDEDPCTQMGTCSAGLCETLPTPCVDDNPCSIDSCDATAGGCIHKAQQDGVPCNPTSPCLENGTCTDGLCAGAQEVICDSGPCDIRACDEDTGTCMIVSMAPDGSACDLDIPCADQGTCQTGSCAAQGTSGCDDGDACTLDICDPASNTCSHKPMMCLAPAGEPCVEATCVPDVGCVKAPSPECESAEAVLWSTSFDCSEESPWTFFSEGDGPEFSLEINDPAPPEWDEDCSLNLQGMEKDSDTDPGSWTASAVSPPFGLPADSGGNLSVSFMDWWEALEVDDTLERRVQVISPQGEVLAETPLISGPGDGTSWQKQIVNLSLTASTSAVHLVIMADGATFQGGWFVDKLVVTLAP